MLNANAEHIWGDWIDINDVPVDASGVYTIDFGAQGWDVQYGDSFNLHSPTPQPSDAVLLLAPRAGTGHRTSGTPTATPAPAAWSTSTASAIENNGNGTAENVQIVDTLPASTTWAGDTSGVTPITGTGVVTWNLGDVAPNSKVLLRDA